MNKLQKLFLVLGPYSFLVVVGIYSFLVFSMSISDYDWSLYYHHYTTIAVPSYEFDAVVSGIISIICLSIALTIQFKKLPDLRQKEELDMILADKDLDFNNYLYPFYSS